MASKILNSLTQSDVPTLSYRATVGLNECLYLAANEPSLGMYRIQEHIQGVIPRVVELKQNLQSVKTKFLAYIISHVDVFSTVKIVISYRLTNHYSPANIV